MCCRYWADESPEIREIVERMNRSPLVEKWQGNGEIVTRGEVRPTNVAPVIASNRSGARSVFPMKWGFSGRSLLVNARTETAAQKPTFREAWASHRCVVPASYYMEWEHFTGASGRRRTGDRYLIRPEDGGMTWLCGLYRIEAGLPVFVILTREPGESTRFIHDRMPLILPEACVNDWIKPDNRPEDLLGMALTEMICTRDGDARPDPVAEGPAGRYVVFDVETPNRYNDRMSAIGISVVQDGRIVDEFFTYVDPEAAFDRFNTQLTGISAETVASAPTFPQLWQEIEPMMSSGVLVAHNAPFDLTVLKKCLNDYGITWKRRVRYACTVQIGRRVLPGIGHKLNEMCDHYHIALDHHQADSDSHAAAEILIRYMDQGVDVERFVGTWGL